MENRTVLVIEHDPLNTKLLRTLLTLGGYLTVEAADAEDGIRAARECSPDCVIIDVRLPGLDGMRTIQIIKEDTALRALPVIAVTPDTTDLRQEAIQAGCDAYITRPIASSSFLETVGRLVETPAAHTLAGTARVLVADDEPMVVDSLALGLRSKGYEVIKAFSGEEAIRKAAEEYPDLILLDVRMPDLDGYEVTRRLKGDVRTLQIPIVLVTALSDAHDKAVGLEAGADEFLSKPVDQAELLVRISSILRLKQYSEQLRFRSMSGEKTVPEGEADFAGSGEAPRILLSSANGGLDGLRDLLASKGFDVRAAGHAEDLGRAEGLAGASLIILDAEGRGAEALEICRRLKQREETQFTPLVVLDPENDPESRVRFLSSGADDIMMPPVDAREILARVGRLLKQKGELESLRARYHSALSASTNDTLTGLFNQGYFKRFLILELKRSLRQNHPTSLVLMDIDDFKTMNDTLGHLAGDQILGELAGRIRSCIREIDLPARYGGEEFVVVLPYTGREGAVVVAERIRAAIAAREFLQGSSFPQVQVTVSIGVAAGPENGSLPEELISAADALLYKAKRGGKNRIAAAAT
jgi:two-component system cell cycle response regulator